MLRLKDDGLEHGYRIKRWTPARGLVAIAQSFNVPGPEILKVYRRIQNLQRITIPADPCKVFRQIKKTTMFHHSLPMRSNPVSES